MADDAPRERTSRDLWRAIEPIHAVCYFHPRSGEALAEVGLRGWWMGYFGGRFAPLGAVGPGPVTALAFGFAPRMVARALPDAWSFADPEAVVARRVATSGEILRELLGPEAEPDVAHLSATLEQVVAASDTSGRALAAAWRDVALPDDPHARLWQLATVVREHRGDGHVAAAIAHDLTGLPASIVHVAAGGTTREALQPNRGWTDDEWDDATDALRGRGILGPSGELTEVGTRLHDDVESTTDRLAAAPLAAIDEAELAEAVDGARRLARTLVASGTYPLPNAMGAPDPG